MNDSEFRMFLDLMMVSDPWPLSEAYHQVALLLVEKESKNRGFADWIEAYHDFQT